MIKNCKDEENIDFLIKNFQPVLSEFYSIKPYHTFDEISYFEDYLSYTLVLKSEYFSEIRYYSLLYFYLYISTGNKK